MKAETQYPKEVTINGVIDGVKNPTAILFYDPKGNPAKYGIPEPDGKIKRYFDLWQVDAMPELFTPVTPKPKTHEIKILIDGQESRPFREIEEPGRIIIQSGSGSVATIDIGSGEEVDQVKGGETDKGEGYTDKDLINWWSFAFDKWDSRKSYTFDDINKMFLACLEEWKESRK